MNDAERVNVDGIAFDNLTLGEATSAIVTFARMRDRPRFVCTANLDHLAVSSRDREFTAAYQAADLVVADGAPVVWLSKLKRGPSLKARVTGSDLFWSLGRASSLIDVKIFLLGGLDGSADLAAAALEARHPTVRVAGTYCPPKESFSTRKEQERIFEAVRVAKPDILMVAFGAPKQEKWIAANLHRLNVPVSIGVGGSFEMAAGLVTRAPRILQRAGLEWAWRLAHEPKRLARRYIMRDLPYLMRATARAAFGSQ